MVFLGGGGIGAPADALTTLVTQAECPYLAGCSIQYISVLHQSHSFSVLLVLGVVYLNIHSGPRGVILIEQVFCIHKNLTAARAGPKRLVFVSRT